MKKKETHRTRRAATARADSEVSTTLNLSLPENMKDFVENEVRRGSFTSSSEYVRSLIRERMAEEDREVRHREIAKGLFGSASSPAEARRLVEAIELFDAGVKLTEERLRRRFPDATAADIARHLADWLQKRGDDAPSGDGPGRPVSAERLRRLRGG